jgi:hypothetical protein
MQLATSEKQQKTFARMQATNDLSIVRPPVLIDEIQWGQMNIDGELNCFCEDPRARRAESRLRQALYRAKHLKADTMFEPFFRVRMRLESTGSGLPKLDRSGDIRGKNSGIASHQFEDLLEDESILETLHMPKFTLRPDIDEENMNYFTELFGDTMPVKLCGHNYFTHSVWDDIAHLRGIEPIMIDMYDRPEYLHALMQHYVDVFKAEMDFAEANMPIDRTVTDMHCTPAVISGLSDDGLKATWFRASAQALSTVSPAMFEEFEIRYVIPLSERFAYTYYGCCEPLHDRMDIVKKIPNLRKIGVSPWANVDSSAEQIGKDYVLARKPNPAHVALHTDPEIVRKETKETVKAAIRYGCPTEFVLKDISTVSNRPENLIVWANTVSEVLDQYYGE